MMSEKKAKYIKKVNGKWIVQIQKTKKTNYYRVGGFKSLQKAIEHRDYILSLMAKGKVVKAAKDDDKYIIGHRGNWAVCITKSKHQKQYWKSPFATKAAARKHRDEILSGATKIKKYDAIRATKIQKHKKSLTYGIRENANGSYRIQVFSFGVNVYVNRYWKNKEDVIKVRNEIIDELLRCKTKDEVKDVIRQYNRKKDDQRNNLHEGSYISSKESPRDGKKKYGISIRSNLDKKTRFYLTGIKTYEEAKEIRDWMLGEIDGCETKDDLLSFKKSLREFSESRNRYGKSLEKSLSGSKTKVELSDQHIDLLRKSSVSGYHARVTETKDWKHFENIRGAIEYVVGNHPKAPEYRGHLINLRTVDKDVSDTKKN